MKIVCFQCKKEIGEKAPFLTRERPTLFVIGASNNFSRDDSQIKRDFGKANCGNLIPK